MLHEMYLLNMIISTNNGDLAEQLNSSGRSLKSLMKRAIENVNNVFN